MQKFLWYQKWNQSFHSSLAYFYSFFHLIFSSFTVGLQRNERVNSCLFYLLFDYVSSLVPSLSATYDVPC